MIGNFEEIMILLMSVFILIFIIAMGLRTIFDTIHTIQDKRYVQIKQHVKEIESFLKKQGFKT